MTRAYYEYTEDFYLELDLKSLIRQSVLNFDKYLLKVREELGNHYKLFLMNLAKHLNQDENYKIEEQYEHYCRELMKTEGDRIHADDFHRFRFLPQYQRLKALSDVIGKENALRFTKDYIDEFYLKLPSREDAPTSIKALKDLQIEGNIKGQDMHWISHELDEHSYLNVVTKCRIHEVLREYDAELMEVITCYPDFSMFQSVNPNFVLTRTQTLIGGALYCDTCYHDRRYHKSFEHPQKGIFDECLQCIGG